jgi:AhpD family alkylhydroperoxidase
MAEDHIATVKPIEEVQATGKVADIFADIKQTKNIDFVPALWRTIATNPAQLELVWTSLKTLMHPEAFGRLVQLDPRTREIIALAVSATNGCPYCVNSHTAALRKLGMDQETLGEVMAIVGLFNMTNSLANGYQVKPDIWPPQEEDAPSTNSRI